jgi:hypothetical protein
MSVAQYTLLVEYTVSPAAGENMVTNLLSSVKDTELPQHSRDYYLSKDSTPWIFIYFINGLLNYKNENMASVKFVICLS